MKMIRGFTIAYKGPAIFTMTYKELVLNKSCGSIYCSGTIRTLVNLARPRRNKAHTGASAFRSFVTGRHSDLPCQQACRVLPGAI
jgi:hypothetical protein